MIEIKGQQQGTWYKLSKPGAVTGSKAVGVIIERGE